MKTTVVIGAGPAGLISAYFRGKRGERVYLIEKNEKAGDAFFDIREKFGKSAISCGSGFERKDSDSDG